MRLALGSRPWPGWRANKTVIAHCRPGFEAECAPDLEPFAAGHCRRTIFNLKLPVKER